MNKECENCIKRKTMWCPPSCECMALDELPYHLDKTLALQKIDNLQQENKRLKSYNKLCIKQSFTTRKLNNLNCILTELEEWLEDNWKSTQDIWYVKIINKIQELKEKYNYK